MPLELLATLPRQGEPGPRPVLDVTLVHLHITRFLEGAHLLGENGIAHLDVVADEAELSPVGGGEQCHDGESNGVTEQVVQVVAGMPQRLRQTSTAPTGAVRGCCAAAASAMAARA